MAPIVKGMTRGRGGALMVGREGVLRRSTSWIDTVKRGDMTRVVRGLGTLTENRAAELKIPEAQSSQIASGQTALIDTRAGGHEGYGGWNQSGRGRRIGHRQRATGS